MTAVSALCLLPPLCVARYLSLSLLSPFPPLPPSLSLLPHHLPLCPHTFPPSKWREGNMKQPMEHQAAAVEARRQGGKEAGGQLPRPLSPAKRKLKSCNRCDAHSLPEPPGLRLSRTTGTETLTQRSAILSRLLFSRGLRPNPSWPQGALSAWGTGNNYRQMPLHQTVMGWQTVTPYLLTVPYCRL